MTEIPLAKFCEDNSQRKAAEIIGCTQSAVSQMIQSRRNIFIYEKEDGTLGCREIRIPKPNKAA